MRPDDLDALKRDLMEFRAEFEDPGLRAALVETAWPRILATLEMIPDAYRDRAILELGSSPYLFSLCLYRMCTGTLRRGNFFGPDATHGADQLVNRRTGQSIEFAYERFNIETEPFPYADASFDVVVFCELIEHLAVNPVHALAEIHRVLRPGGIVIISTPNSLSLERFARFVRAGSLMEERYSPLFGYGGRHNREYHPRELRELLESTGFIVEELATRDICPLALPRDERWRRAIWRRFLAHYGDTSRDEHIFLRVRRGERFRWAFPPTLFDSTQFYTLIKYPWVEMGVNDSIQCVTGWYPLERGADGVELRWIAGAEGQAFLKAPERVGAFGIELLAPTLPGATTARLHLIVWDRWMGPNYAEAVYVDADATVERGGWQRIVLPLTNWRPQSGDSLEVKIQPAASGERERGLAVRRFWCE